MFMMLIRVNLFCVFIFLNYTKGSADTGLTREVKNYIGSSIAYTNSKTGVPYLQKIQDMSSDESNDISSDPKQLDENLFDQNKTKHIKYYNYKNNNYDEYEKNLFENVTKMYTKPDRGYENNDKYFYNKYLKENMKRKEYVIDRIRQDNKAVNNGYIENDKSFRNRDSSDNINAYKYKNINDKKPENSRSIVQTTVHYNDMINKNIKYTSKHSASINDNLFGPHNFNKPFETEFSRFINNFLKFHPLINSLLLTPDLDKFNIDRNNNPELNNFFNFDKIRHMKNEIGERIKHHRPCFTGNVKELNELEKILSNPVLKENSLIDNVVNVQNFISNIAKTVPRKSERYNIDDDKTNIDHEQISNNFNLKSQPLKYRNKKLRNNFLSNDLRHGNEHYRKWKNSLDNDISNVLYNKGVIKKFSNFSSLNNQFTNQGENLKSLNNTLNTDEALNKNSLDSSGFLKNEIYSPKFLSQFLYDRLDKNQQSNIINNKMDDSSKIDRNDDYYYHGISNSFHDNHLSLVPSSILMKTLNKRDALPSALVPDDLHYPDFDSSIGKHKHFNDHKNRKDKNNNYKILEFGDSSSSESSPIDSDSDTESKYDIICRTYTPKKHSRHPTSTMTCEPTEEEEETTSCEPFEETTSTVFEEETTSCEPEDETSTTECESSEVMTTTCEPSASDEVDEEVTLTRETTTSKPKTSKKMKYPSSPSSCVTTCYCQTTESCEDEDDRLTDVTLHFDTSVSGETFELDTKGFDMPNDSDAVSTIKLKNTQTDETETYEDTDESSDKNSVMGK